MLIWNGMKRMSARTEKLGPERQPLMRTKNIIIIVLFITIPAIARAGIIDKYLTKHPKSGICYIGSYANNLYYLVEMDPEKMNLTGSAPLPLPMKVNVLDRKGGSKTTTLHTMKQFETFFKPLTNLVLKKPESAAGITKTGIDEALRNMSPWTMVIFVEKNRMIGILIPKPYTDPGQPMVYTFDSKGKFTNLLSDPVKIEASIGTNPAAYPMYEAMETAGLRQKFLMCATELTNLRSAIEMTALELGGEHGRYENGTAENICKSFINEKNCGAEAMNKRFGASCYGAGGGEWRYDTEVDISDPATYTIKGTPKIPGACTITITPDTTNKEIQDFEACIKTD